MVWFFGIKKRKIEQIVEEARAACSDMRELRCADRLDQALKIVVLVKSLLINGETLKNFKTTLTKQMNKIIVQVQRLTKETRFYRDVIVRTA